MVYKNLADCAHDLQKNGQLVRIPEPVDPHLELAAIHRRVHSLEGPALLFENVKGSQFPVLTNLFGTHQRTEFIFRHTLNRVQALIQAKAQGPAVLKKAANWWRIPVAAGQTLPHPTWLRKGVLQHQCQISDLPQIHSWPDDGGAFLTLPQVYSEDPQKPGALNSNLGMYRIQLSGNQYNPNQEVGLHYQIHRGIGIHHSRARELGQRLPVSIFAGGPPAHTLAAVMPLPEGLPEILFAGALAGRGVRTRRLRSGHLVAIDSDFCICGTIANYLKPEGPFGDHLGYYALKHDFPVLQVERVYHRPGAIWPATVVGRPPAEDSSFGSIIQQITAPMVPVSIPGVDEMHAVDAAGVHPLMLAIGSERYTPWNANIAPQELLTQANAILGFGHASLAKYLIISSRFENPNLSTHDIKHFWQHVLSRFDPERDLHFITNTTIDTLDYSAGQGLNRGSKLIWAVHGKVKRRLSRQVPQNLSLAKSFSAARIVLPGILAIQGPGWRSTRAALADINRLARHLKSQMQVNIKLLAGLPLIVLCEDSEFLARSLRNFLWIAFTRSDPAQDLHGVDSFIQNKHWGCKGPLILDARPKSHHAPELQSDPEVERQIERLGQPGFSLHGII